MRRLSCCGSRLLDTGFFALVLLAGGSALAGLFHPAYRLNHIWIRGGGVLPWVDALALFVCVVLLGRTRAGLRGTARVVAGVLGLLCLRDAVVFFDLLATGRIQTAVPVPLSLGVAGLWAWGVVRLPRLQANGRVRHVVFAAFALPVLALGHVVTLGGTDYRRSADAAVVFGAAVRPDGAPSLALLDRTRTACALYHEGRVRYLVLSGGRDPRAPISEPVCMAQIARAQGVPESALVLDERGRTTRASLDELARLTRARGWERTLLVSHDYHLARIALGARRRALRAFTVPARQSRPWVGKPAFVAREVAALLWYAVTDV